MSKKMPTLSDLNLDIVLLIFEQLTGEGSHTLNLKSLCLVCRRFRTIASSQLFKNVMIRVPQDDEREVSKNIADHSLGLITFLSDNEHIRTQVKDLFILRQIPEYVPKDLGPLNHLLTKLIPLLPLMNRLRHVRVSRIGSARFPLRDESEEPHFLEAIQKLESNVTLSVGRNRGPRGGYVHTWNPNLFLDRITCLESLQVDILNTPEYSHHGGPRYDSFEGTPSKDIGSIILQNAKLKDLHLRLNEPSSILTTHGLQDVEQENALENIGESIHALRSMTIEGPLHFTPSAWFAWEFKMNLAGLRSLSVITEPLIHEVTEHTHVCPSLETLKFDVRHDYKMVSGFDPRHSHRFQTDITQFLSSLTLKHLSLISFHPENLDALQGSGAKLRRLLFHVREGPKMWTFGPHMIRSPNTYKDVLLSASRLQSLQMACPRLDWLAFDILPFHLSNAITTSDSYTPVSGHSPSAYRELIQKSEHQITYIQDRRAAESILRLQNPQEDFCTTPDPIFVSLTRFGSLRHLRLFIHGISFLAWIFTLTDAMRLFLWLRRNKLGVALESLVVYCGPEAIPSLTERNEVGPWIVYEMGQGMLYTVEVGETVLWKVKGDTGSEVFEIIERKRSVRDGIYDRYAVWDRLEDLDAEGWAVPSEWP